MFSIIAVAWQWLLQANVLEKAMRKGPADLEATFYKGKLYAFRFFFSYELPKIEGLVRRLTNSDGLTLEMDQALFAD